MLTLFVARLPVNPLNSERADFYWLGSNPESMKYHRRDTEVAKFFIFFSANSSAVKSRFWWQGGNSMALS
jgi:hypothetical protein